jgi:cytochrome c biogenesis protein
MEKWNCECGHLNPAGTSLCGHCGKPIAVSEPKLDMRYEGVARRSQVERRSLPDQAWAFFSSVKVGIYILAVLLLALVAGTVLPQENQLLPGVDHQKFYIDRYGDFGLFYYTIGLTNTFNTWWFAVLLIMLGASLTISSLDRVIPLYKALKKQKARRHPQFLQRQKVNVEQPLPAEDAEALLDALESQLKKRRYQVIREPQALLAEKGRFSRWGPYINHLGLIIILIAALIRQLPDLYMDELISVMDGETIRVPGTEYFFQNEKFTLELYSPEDLPEGVTQGVNTPKKYQTDAVLYRCEADCSTPQPKLTEVKRGPITVNSPFEHKGVKFYQFDYELGKIKSVEVDLLKLDTGDSLGSFVLDFYHPHTIFKLGPTKVQLIQYYPDFAVETKDGAPQLVTKSRNPNNPAFTFRVTGPVTPNGDVVLYAPLSPSISKRINESVGTKYGVDAEMADVRFVNSTTLNVRKDEALPLFLLGAIISMIGLMMGFYWQHRRVWLLADQGKLWLAAHTNKNWYALRSDILRSTENTRLTVTMDELKDGGK